MSVSTRRAAGDSVTRSREEPRPGDHQEVLIRILSFTVSVASNSPAILRVLASLYPVAMGGVRPPASPYLRLCVTEQGRDGEGHGYELREANGTSQLFSSTSDAVAHLDYRIAAAALRHLSRHLLVHAGAVVGSGDGVLLPATSGGGKSTLVAALCLSGFRYLSDELAILAGERPAMLPFPRVICLKAGGWRALAESFDVPPLSLEACRDDGERVGYLPAPLVSAPGSPVPVRYIVVPVRRPGAHASLAPLSRAATVVELVRQSLNLPRHGRKGVESLARVVEGAECYSLTYDCLPEAVDRVSDLVGADRMAIPGPGSVRRRA